MDRVSAPRGDHLRIGALVDLEDKVCVQALGALIGFLSESSRNALETGGVTLSSLRRMNLGDFMHISAVSSVRKGLRRIARLSSENAGFL